MWSPCRRREGTARRLPAVIGGIGAAVAGLVAVLAAAAVLSTGGAGPAVPSGQTTICGAPAVVIVPGAGAGGDALNGLGSSAPSPSPDPATADDGSGDAGAAGGSDGMDLCQEPGATPAVTPSTP